MISTSHVTMQTLCLPAHTHTPPVSMVRRATSVWLKTQQGRQARWRWRTHRHTNSNTHTTISIDKKPGPVSINQLPWPVIVDSLATLCADASPITVCAQLMWFKEQQGPVRRWVWLLLFILNRRLGAVWHSVSLNSGLCSALRHLLPAKHP